MTQAQHSTLALGITAISVLAAGAFNVWEDRFVATVVFLGAVPLLTAMILLIWASQIWGMLDIGRYLLTLERKIGERVDPKPSTGLMTWEKQVSHQIAWSREPNYAMHYVAVMGLFGFLTLASIVLGVYRAWDQHELEAVLGGLLSGGVFTALFVGLAWSVLTARNRRGAAARGPADP
jgi:hypothetical protein